MHCAITIKLAAIDVKKQIERLLKVSWYAPACNPEIATLIKLSSEFSFAKAFSTSPPVFHFSPFFP